MTCTADIHAGTPPKFNSGQVVVFVNDYGVNWGRKVLSLYEWNEVRGHTWQYEGTDTPWFYSSECVFYDPQDVEAIREAEIVGRKLSVEMYGEY